MPDENFPLYGTCVQVYMYMPRLQKVLGSSPDCPVFSSAWYHIELAFPSLTSTFTLPRGARACSHCVLTMGPCSLSAVALRCRAWRSGAQV